MVWNSFGDFLNMGGYALYVWGSVTVTFGFMAVEMLILRLRRRTILGYLGRMKSLGEEERVHEGQK